MHWGCGARACAFSGILVLIPQLGKLCSSETKSSSQTTACRRRAPGRCSHVGCHCRLGVLLGDRGSSLGAEGLWLTAALTSCQVPSFKPHHPGPCFADE